MGNDESDTLQGRQVLGVRPSRQAPLQQRALARLSRLEQQERQLQEQHLSSFPLAAPSAWHVPSAGQRYSSVEPQSTAAASDARKAAAASAKAGGAAQGRPDSPVSLGASSEVSVQSSSGFGGTASSGATSDAAGEHRSASPDLPTGSRSRAGVAALGPVRESVFAAATAPPRQPLSSGRGLFKPEASVFVSQFVSDAAPRSPQRNATWCVSGNRSVRQQNNHHPKSWTRPYAMHSGGGLMVAYSRHASLFC